MAVPRPPASADHVRRRFERQRRRDTKPEMLLRRELHRRGLRYRVDTRVVEGLRRRADLLFSGPKVAVFVDGCFWHRCPEHGNIPKSNTEWWKAKLERNVERDRDTDERLHRAGWMVIRVWEHELKDNHKLVADRVEALVRASDA